ncbi:hypothetical protein [Pseudohalioglobus lutimaris]|uniref:Uncharacterized protein n=1 Tax=Pseudohalioglobus lutimaris TaxID=1737061 RepID=A0A2N5WXN0_9GAMM|nr:hypothetical protein [Pseudohalioglobus lutimaris]PLW66992.1 hypothetical protein C0039_18985 [Pseudohalioglobus lutimaris]
MESRYNIYYAGEILDGQQAEQVREKLRALFKADDAALDKLFSGTEQVVKRECDKSTALKYKQAMERAGARPVIKVVRSSNAAAAPDPAPEAPAARKLTTAERIAALAAAPDINIASAEEAPPEIDEETGWQLEPVGADILRPEERSQPVVADIDISALDVAATIERLSPQPPTPPPAPDTSHLDMGAVGETIPTLPATQAPLNPNTDNLDLSPEGTDFSDCTPPPPTPPAVDLSGINLASAGSDMVEEQYRQKSTPRAPDTEHITLQD